MMKREGAEMQGPPIGHEAESAYFNDIASIALGVSNWLSERGVSTPNVTMMLHLIEQEVSGVELGSATAGEVIQRIGSAYLAQTSPKKT